MKLDEIQATVERISNDVGPSVVGIGDRWAVGSGVVVGRGRVLTNAHNLRGERVNVTFFDDRTATGTPEGVDVDGDVAVISVDTGDAPPLSWPAGPNGVRIGTPVFALANPGGRGLRVTFGLVSGTQRSFRGPRGRRITGSLEHTAPLLPGSSGGPTVDASARLLGLNTNRLGEGFYLAIPADEDLRRRTETMGRGESPGRPRLGIAVAPSEVARRMRKAVGLPERDGLLIRQVEEGGPAHRAGLLEGDLIVAAGGAEVTDADDLYSALETLAGGGSLELRVVRGTEERTITVGGGPSA